MTKDQVTGQGKAHSCDLEPWADTADLYLVLDLIGAGGFASLGLLNPVLQQESLNRVWRAAEDVSGRL